MRDQKRLETMQAHLLRVLDAGEYQCLGESRPRRSELRLVAATNRPAKTLKHDFLARLALQLRVPPLRERREDIPLLVRHLLRRVAAGDPQLRARFFDDNCEPRVQIALVDALLHQDLPTNVREIERLLWLAMLTSTGERVRLTDEAAALLPPVEVSEDIDPTAITAEDLDACLRRNDGVQARVVEELGLRDRYVLRRLIRKFDKEGWDFGR